MTSSRTALVPQLPDLDKIRQMRKRLNLSQRELAGMAGVSQSLIAKIERGTIDPSYSNVRKILSAFEEVIRRRKVEGVRSGTQLTVGRPGHARGHFRHAGPERRVRPWSG